MDADRDARVLEQATARQAARRETWEDLRADDAVSGRQPCIGGDREQVRHRIRRQRLAAGDRARLCRGAGRRLRERLAPMVPMLFSRPVRCSPALVHNSIEG